MKPEHLALLRLPGRPTATADHVVVAVSRPDLDHDAYRSTLWRFAVDGDAAPRRLTAGPHDSSPVLSPDGTLVAVLRAGDGPPQLALVPVDGGEPRVLTSHRLGVSGRPAWSPDGRRLAYCAAVPEEGRYGTAEGVGPDAEPARHITTFTYRADGAGFTQGRPHHLHVIDVPAAPEPGDGAAPPLVPVRLTDGDAPVTGPVWSPDGAVLLAHRDPADALATDLVHVVLPVLPPSAAQVEEEHASRDGVLVPAVVTALPLRDGVELSVGDVAFLAADEIVLLATGLGADRLQFIGSDAALYRARLTGTALADPVRLTDPLLDRLAGGTGDAELQVLDRAGAPAVLLRREERGRTQLVRLDLATSGSTALEVLHPGSVVGATALPDGRVVVSAVLADSPGEVLVLEDGVARPLTTLGRGLASVAPVRPSVEVTATAPDGYPVHGWLALPDPAVHGEGPYPVLLNVHGGPYAQYEDVFFDETQVCAGAGYAVVYGNPRGSAGYGAAHGRAIRGAFGTVDADDVLALLDAALAGEPRLDAARVGVMGGSYGGYMSAWLTTRTDRFAGAVVERGFLDPVSFEGSSDIGWFFGLQYVGEDADVVAAQSPMARLDRVHTPTLVIHSEHDWRCPVEQGQRWYVGLRRRGVEAELLLFPGEGHELSRSGRPKHRLQRFEAILHWWERRLPTGV